MLRQFDIQLFEYIHHLFYENKSESELQWKDHVSCGWKPDQWLLNYYKLAFEKSSSLIENKNILDVGCHIGCKISWFENLGAKSYTGLDPDPVCISYATIISKIVDLKCNITQSTAEDFKYKKYDTAFILGVLHHFRDETSALEKILNCCENIVIDTWVNCNNCKDLSYYINFLEKQSFKIISIDQVKTNRYVIISSKQESNKFNFWSL